MPAPKGNRNAQKYTVEEWVAIFEGLLEEAQDMSDMENNLSVQELLVRNKIRTSTFHDLCKKHIELERLKKDIHSAIVAKVNKLSVTGKGNATGCIWRMKQLGERDQSHVDHTSGGEKIDNTPKIVFTNGGNKD